MMCANPVCGAPEDRVKGYCSCQCRDIHELIEERDLAIAACLLAKEALRTAQPFGTNPTDREASRAAVSEASFAIRVVLDGYMKEYLETAIANPGRMIAEELKQRQGAEKHAGEAFARLKAELQSAAPPAPKTLMEVFAAEEEKENHS